MLDHDLTHREPADLALDNALDCWRSYMHAPAGPMGFAPHAVGVMFRASSSFEDMTDAVDDAQARAVDACIDSLAPMHRHALEVAMLRTRWRGPAFLYASTLAEARRALLQLLLRRHAIVL